ncbi:unnamed protein product [Boreogadus saida]
MSSSPSVVQGVPDRLEQTLDPSISSELVEGLRVQLVPTLHPVDRSGGQALSPQDLQGLFVHPVATKPKKKKRRRKWYSYFRGLFVCCRGQSE